MTSREKESWESVNPYRVAVAPSLETVGEFVAAITGSDEKVINHSLWEARQDEATLLEVFSRLADVSRPDGACRAAFHGAWVTQGLRIRDTFSVDPLLLGALANLLPGYFGPPVELYRGDRLSNFLGNTTGPSWTTNRDVAEMFASGLNRCPESGGVLLRTIAPPHAILAEPNEHSISLDEHEYIVDRRALTKIEVVQKYSPNNFGRHTDAT